MAKGEKVGLKLQAWMEAPNLTLVNLSQMVAMTVRETGSDRGDILGIGPDGKEWQLASSVPLEAARVWLVRASQSLNSKDAGGFAFGVLVPIG